MKLSLPLKLAVYSLFVTIFLNESKGGCSSRGYGLPLDFFQSYCECGRHSFPIDIINLSIDIAYHFIVWYSIKYLWNDAQETWAMMKEKYFRKAKS